jgi:hypothetical protein
VRGQPVSQWLGIAPFEKVKRRAGLAVDQQHAVVLATPDREVIDPEHSGDRRGGVGDGHDQPQHDLSARRHAQAGRQPRSRPARQRDGDASQHPGQQREECPGQTRR